MPERRATTITISIPRDFRRFFDELAEAGYNRSQLMVKMAKILETLHRKQQSFPGGLPKAIERLADIAARDDFGQTKAR